VKSIFRLVGLLVLLSGWAAAAMCVYIVRIPDAGNPQQSKLLIVPKNHLGPDGTYVDARAWTMADVKSHPLVIIRVLESGKADDFSFLTDPKDKRNAEMQLSDAISDSPTAAAPLSPRTSHSATFSH
jgi:hypothetical protein